MTRPDVRPDHRLNIVADAHIWGVEEAFSSLPDCEVSLRTMEAADITREALQHADILITRSATRVNADLLAGTPVRFAATATIGDDHYDKQWLTGQGIDFANAAGSSTGSVIEYMLTALLELHVRGLITLPELTLGIIGAGRIGGALSDICDRLGIRTLMNDPPRARKEGETGFSELDHLLAGADVLTLHTPLHRSGKDQTLHLLNAERLARFHGRGIINAARGACLDNVALIDWLNADECRFAVLDCWENEPAVSAELLGHPQLALATPHIAGHSLDGKAANTLFARTALCRWLGVSQEWHMENRLPADPNPINISCTSDTWRNLHAAATCMYQIANDDAELRSMARSTQDDIALTFTSLRRNYPIRRGWEHIPVHFLHPDPQTTRLARAMGMQVI